MALEAIVDGNVLSVTGRLVKTARLAEEWYLDVDDPASIVRALRESRLGADVFTFWQRPPDIEPRFSYHREAESIAILRVTTYEHWLKHQINNKTRNLVGKAAKKGVVLKRARFDEAFVRGMERIFNEARLRQGIPFWHYGKDYESLRSEFSRYLFREDLVGAYLDDELVGFIFLANAGRFALLGQIISTIRHRDKSINNALIAKAVELCAERKVPFLTYALWPRGPLQEFKRHSGFHRIDVPRYYIPLSTKGAMALKLGLHRKPIERVPDPLYFVLRDVRTRFYSWRYRRELST